MQESVSLRWMAHDHKSFHGAGTFRPNKEWQRFTFKFKKEFHRVRMAAIASCLAFLLAGASGVGLAATPAVDTAAGATAIGIGRATPNQYLDTPAGGGMALAAISRRFRSRTASGCRRCSCARQAKPG